MTKIGKQREAFDLCFEDIGGREKLQEWAEENLTDFYKLFAKLSPPIKDNKPVEDTQEAFIKLVMIEEAKRIKESGQPVKLIEVDVIENQSQQD